MTHTATITDITCDAAKSEIALAANLIREGKLVVFPTETVYGLGADATSDTAAKAIYQAKGRPADNPLIIHIAAPEEAEKYTVTSPLYYRIAKAFMPGPITVIMTAKDTVPLSVRAGLSTVAVRCPSHPVANAIIRKAGVPIAAPSANLSGKPSPTCFQHAFEDMMGRVDMIIDGGPSQVGVESTIIKLEDDESLTLLRPGKVTVEELYAVCPYIRIAPHVTAELSEGETVLSPGMKYRHYAPSAPVYLLKGCEKERWNYTSKQTGNYAVLCYREEADRYEELCGKDRIFPIGSRDDLDTQAHLLFYALREADKGNYDTIYAPLPPQNGMGLALYNRMIRAAAYQIVDLTNCL